MNYDGFAENNDVKFKAVACHSGVYLARHDEPGKCLGNCLSWRRSSRLSPLAFRRILDVANPTCLLAINEVNKFFVLHESGLCSYSLDLIARAALGTASTQSIEASRERLGTDVAFFRAGRIANRIVGELCSLFTRLSRILKQRAGPSVICREEVPRNGIACTGGSEPGRTERIAQTKYERVVFFQVIWRGEDNAVSRLIVDLRIEFTCDSRCGFLGILTTSPYSITTRSPSAQRTIFKLRILQSVWLYLDV